MTTQAVKQSRLGKRPVAVPSGVTVKIDGRTLSCKGPKGELERHFHHAVTLNQEGDSIQVGISSTAGRQGAQFQGLTRALVSNMVEGVSQGYKKALDLVGVGYRAELKGSSITFSLGLSHQIVHQLDPRVKARVEIIDEGGIKRPRLHLESHCKETLGQTAARIRGYRPPEPYKGKGVRYFGERIREKAGKAGKG